MTVALDATPLSGPTGGIRRYVTELHAAMEREFPEDRFLLLSDQLGEPPRGLARSWWLWGLNQQLAQVDVFQGTDFSVPYFKRRPAVLMIHDLSPWRFRDASDRVRQRVPWLIRLRRYTLILTPSQAVRREVIAHFGLPPSDVVAVPLAASPSFQPVVGEKSNYFLCVGTIEPRKNLQTLLDAFRLVKQADPAAELRIVGRSAHAQLGEEAGVRYLGDVPDEQLPELYSRARAVCYPSLYEGFGLPVLEALQCGAAVITSRDPALMETGGDATIKVEALDPRAWAEAMLQVQPNSKSLRRAAEFSWARTARLTREVYVEAIRRG